MTKAVLILGGGLLKDGQLTPWTKARYDYAILNTKPDYFLTLSGGTTHKPPPLDEYGFPIFEAMAGGQYLRQAGIPHEKILMEWTSYDTIGNALFAKLHHIDPRGLSNLLVVTSKFHMPRTKYIFEWILGLDNQRDKYTVQYAETENIGLSHEVLTARVDKEQKSIEVLKDLSAKYTTMESVHQWIFTGHKAYSVRDNLLREKTPAIGSY